MAKNLNRKSRIVELSTWDLPSLDYNANCGVLERMFELYSEVLLYKKRKDGSVESVYQCNRKQMVEFLMSKID